MAPFFKEVEKALKRPRAEYVEKHHEELIGLQRRFASFDLPEN